MISRTRERVLTLLSGVSRERRGKRIFMVFQAYVDNSWDKHTHVLAGCIATVDDWLQFSDEWRSELNKDGLPSFKMSKIAMTVPKFELITERYYRIIEKYARGTISCVVD